ncbi:GH1 family beta-glucosidase [Actinoalloteichus caeruleus]|uniref:Beta-glucosidase n=2 Tax=Actinoalloteichus cyanogriseus TaxID=2893586 RepID=A0ABT1JR28_ACTCY|nr:GH1 family beta-glucosidase [Actinoalloteichus caeruleus]MCP2334669.1 broad-specificity cellobiase (EC 3.2.1.21) [Actinoalloteichus caeruleus DSM 43889]
MSDLPVLPPDFVFGVATASYQIEGAVREGGRGPSIWDTFSHTPGRVARGETGDVACDHYHRYREDVALLRDLGVDSYRFSTAWPRVQPEGRGPANAAGLDFYDRLVDELLAAGVAPALTLYHWDLPQALEDAGGWRARDTAHRFADYASLVVGRLGDRVARWITLNEPFCSAFIGHAEGRHAPGAREGTPALAAAHHLLLAHGLAVSCLRDAGAGEVGITLNPERITAVGDGEEEIAAARRAETLRNLAFTDPILGARYPEWERETWGPLADGSYRRDGDLAVIAAPLDFLGVNYYAPSRVAPAPRVEADPARRTAWDVGAVAAGWPGARTTEMGWPVVPSTLTDLLTGLVERYPGLPPLYITENGSAEADQVGPDGVVHDEGRVDYLREHLGAVARAVDLGVDVRGYYAWSLLDNFEWAYGYDRRFGLVHVDYDTQTRTPKDSYHWYRRAIAGHRERSARG